jgi:hypothetical protein
MVPFARSGNRSFFRFLFGFFGILAAAIFTLLVLGYYEYRAQGGDEDLSTLLAQ